MEQVLRKIEGGLNAASHNSTPKTGNVWDFLTATRDEATFRSIRDKFPDFDLAQVPGNDEVACLIWRLRCEFDVSAVQQGYSLEEVVSNALHALSDADPDARDALEWLCDPEATAYKLSEAPKVARRLVEQWQKPPRFAFLTLCDVLTRPDPRFLVDRLLTVGGTSLLTAKHASFKSFFALDLALCVATGRPFHGLEVERGGVVYVAAEGAAGIKKRAAAWLTHHGCLAPSAFVVLDTPFQVANAADRAAFVAATCALMPSLVIIDTLARCAVGLEENSAADMGAFADALGDLARATGAHVLTVHHNNKLGEYRGSSALPAAVDTCLTLERHKETDRVTLTTEKQKDAEELAPLSFEKIEVALPDTGGLGHSLVFSRIETATGGEYQLSQGERNVLGELSGAFGDSGATAAQWCKVCEDAGISKRAFYYSKTKLLKFGAVSCPDDAKRGAIYSPNPDWCKGAT